MGQKGVCSSLKGSMTLCDVTVAAEPKGCHYHSRFQFINCAVGLGDSGDYGSSSLE